MSKDIKYGKNLFRVDTGSFVGLYDGNEDEFNICIRSRDSMGIKEIKALNAMTTQLLEIIKRYEEHQNS